MLSVTAQPITPAQTPEALFDNFLRLYVAGGDASTRTIDAYRAHLRDYLAWCQRTGCHPLNATVHDVAAYRAELIGTYARGTGALKLQVVRRFYAALQAAGYRTDHPATVIRMPADRTGTDLRVKYLEDGALRALIRHTAAPRPAFEHDQAITARDRAMIAMMLLQGARVGEVTDLNCADLNLDAQTALLRGKGNKQRRAYLTADTTRALHAWLALRPDMAQDDAVFVSLSRNAHFARLTRRGARLVIKNHLRAAGVNEYGKSAHALRHTFAVNAHARGASLEQLRDTLGHSSVTTTEIYAKVVDARDRSAAEHLNHFITELQEDV